MKQNDFFSYLCASIYAKSKNKETKMISIAERHKYIKDQLAKNGFIRVLDIADQLGVTGATIRKDL